MHPGCIPTEVYLCREPVDFRKSIGGLSALVEQELGLNPFGTALYVFINRQRDKLKALYWHRNGFCLWYKCVQREKFAWPRHGTEATLGVTMQELQWLLEGFDLWNNGPHKILHYQSVS